MALMTMEEYDRYIQEQQGGGSNATPVSAPVDQPNIPMPDEEGSILRTARAKADYAEALDEEQNPELDAELSRFATRRREKLRDEYVAEQKKLSLPQNVAAELTYAAPSIVAGMVPVVGDTLGGVVSANQSRLQTMMEQDIAGQEIDPIAAGLAGAATGVTDFGFGRYAKHLRTALPLAAPLAKKVGINFLEDTGSAVAGQYYENLGSGKAWDDNLGTAAAFGAGAGQALRGSAAGLQKAIKTPINQWGTETSKALSDLRSRKLSPKQEFGDNAYGYSNISKEFTDQIDNVAVDDIDGLTDAINRKVTFAETAGGDAALVKTFDILSKKGLKPTDAGLDITYDKDLSGTQKANAAEEVGLSRGDISSAQNAQIKARTSRWQRNKDKVVREGSSKEAYAKEFKDDYTRATNEIEADYGEANIATIETQLGLARDGGASQRTIQDLEDLLSDMKDLNSMVGKVLSRSGVKLGSDAKVLARRIETGLAKTRLRDQLNGLDGSKGSIDVITDLMALQNLKNIAQRQLPDIHEFTPKPYEEKAPTIMGGRTGAAIIGSAMGAGGLTVGPIGMAVAGAAGAGISAGSALRGAYTRARLKGHKAKTAETLKAIVKDPRGRMAEAIKAGDSGAAAKAAGEDLENQGIGTGNMTEPVSTTVEKAREAAGARSREIKDAFVPVEEPTVSTKEPAARVINENPEPTPKAPETLQEKPPTEFEVPDGRRFGTPETTSETAPKKAPLPTTLKARSKTDRAIDAAEKQRGADQKAAFEKIEKEAAAKKSQEEKDAAALKPAPKKSRQQKKAEREARARQKAAEIREQNAEARAKAQKEANEKADQFSQKGTEGTYPAPKVTATSDQAAGVAATAHKKDFTQKAESTNSYPEPKVTLTAAKPKSKAAPEAAPEAPQARQKLSAKTPTAHTKKGSKGRTAPDEVLLKKAWAEAQTDEDLDNLFLLKDGEDDLEADFKAFEDVSNKLDETPVAHAKETAKTRKAPLPRQPKKSPGQKLRENLTEDANRYKGVPRNKLTTEQLEAHNRSQEDLKDFDRIVEDISNIPRAEVESIIAEMGGMQGVRDYHKSPRGGKGDIVSSVRKWMANKNREAGTIAKKKLDAINEKDSRTEQTLKGKVSDMLKILEGEGVSKEIRDAAAEFGGNNAAAVRARAKYLVADERLKKNASDKEAAKIRDEAAAELKRQEDIDKLERKLKAQDVPQEIIDEAILYSDNVDLIKTRAEQLIKNQKAKEAKKVAKDRMVEKLKLSGKYTAGVVDHAAKMSDDPVLIKAYADNAQAEFNQRKAKAEQEDLEAAEKLDAEAKAKADEAAAKAADAAKEANAELLRVRQISDIEESLRAQKVDEDIIQDAINYSPKPNLVRDRARALIKERMKANSEAAADGRKELARQEAIETTVESLRIKGIPDNIINDALDKSGNPTIVRQHALEAHRQEVDRVAKLAEASEKRREAARKGAQTKLKKSVDNFTSRKYIEDYVKQLGVSDSNIDNIITSVYGKAGTPHPKSVNVNQVHKAIKQIDDYLDQQLKDYQSVGKTNPQYAEKAHTLIESRKRAKAALERENLERTRQQQEVSDLEEAWEAGRAEFEAAEKARAEADAQAAVQKQLDTQIFDLEKSLRDSGADDEFIQEHLYRNFFMRNKPMTDAEYRKARMTAADKLQKHQDKVAAVSQKKAAEILGELNGSTLREEVMDLMVGATTNVAEKAGTQKGVVKAIEQVAKNLGLEGEAKAASVLVDMMEKIDNRKIMYPDRPEFWISKDDLHSLSKALTGKESSTYYGTLYEKLRLKAFGESEGTKKFVTYTNKKLKEEMDLYDLLGGDIKIKH